MYSVYWSSNSAWGNWANVFDAASPDRTYRIFEPVLSMEDNTAGTFEYTIYNSNPSYTNVVILDTIISIVRNGTKIWEGRVTNSEMQFDGSKKVTCEGALAYFNDTIQPLYRTNTNTTALLFAHIIGEHNQKVETYKQFKIGTITVEKDIDYLYELNYENSMECLSKLIETFGGHFRIRYVGNDKYIDWIADYLTLSKQSVEFGVNLLDYATSFDIDDICTVVVPLGASLQDVEDARVNEYNKDKPRDQQIKATELANGDDRLTCAAANNGSIYVYSEEAIKNFGWIEKTLDLDDVTDPAKLVEYAKQYLEAEQFNKLTIDVTALDMSYNNSRRAWIID